MDARKSRDSWKILKPATASSEATASYKGMSTAAGPPESDSRDVSNRSRISKLEH